MPPKPTNVDEYLKDGCGRCALGGTPDCKVHPWAEVLRSLRAIVLQTELVEVIKWGAPCYTYAGKNVLMLGALKESVVLSFFSGFGNEGYFSDLGLAWREYTFCTLYPV
ncbi:DUF1801 domain-containing protein [Thalassobacterium maritimum]|uniref:DUF1801 domain-containing protein n=1 Tax=Thalassobacterium maritimum TaxID=3041265 RepID=UPI0028112DAB|nr:DUF1801 domain-containing protein [Coraliomargarita sp. SDUM461003]